MSAVAARRPRTPVRRSAPAVDEPARAEALRLIAFTALAGFAAGHWAALLQQPPMGGLAGAVLISVALGAALMALRRARLPGPARHGSALLLALVAGGLALVVAGLPAGLLEPARWDELVATLDRGLAGMRSVSWPYDGADEWVRMVIALGAPAGLVAAAALAFWPVRRGEVALRALGLITLLVLYGTAVTEHDPGEPLIRGLALLLLVAAWLWLPGLRGREAAPAAALVAAVAVLALPVAARLDSGTALIDYRAWDWFGGKDVTFNWDHSYGPLDWPRDGTTVLHVESDRPHYWKAQTLDRFDGLRWVRSRSAERTRPDEELPPLPNPRWAERIHVTVRALRTDFVVAAGTPLLVTGAGEAVSGSADGTLRRLDEPLRRGDSYTVRAYDPDPSTRQMRAAHDAYGPGLSQYTGIALPAKRGETLPDGRGAPAAALVSVPLRGGGLAGTPGAERELAASPYRRTFRLARRLALGAPTVFEAARRIERHLERAYDYSERPPRRRYPLEAFLFRDRAGYCQQFSGAMALMLRMVGIPARVVSGFSPGSLNRDTGEYRVRDLDAHSWVEVFFNGIGWVTFDPTPAAAPADRPEGESDTPRAAADSPGSISSNPGGGAGSEGLGTPAADVGDGDGGGAPPAWAILLALVVLSAGGSAVVLLLRRDGASRSAAADASLRELERALPRLGWELRPGTTLLELEQRLRRAARPRAAAYVAALRAGRFTPGEASAPAPAERRALRRELTAARGIATRARGFLALPPIRPFSRP